MANLEYHLKEIVAEDPTDWSLAYRNDLGDAVGFIISTPLHFVDDSGRVVWGHVDGGMSWSPEVFHNFAAEMESIVTEAVTSNGTLPNLQRTKPSHLYEIPPAAQSWPDLALMLWENIDPLVSSLDTIVSLGLGAREVHKGIRKWLTTKNDEVQAQGDSPNGEGLSERVESKIVITQGTAMALVMSDTVTRYGFAEPIRVSVFPRGIPGYSDPGHPTSQITYLVRCEHGPRVFIYHLESGGKVLEHYLLSGSEITPLPTPNLWEESDLLATSNTGIHLEIGSPPVAKQSSLNQCI